MKILLAVHQYLPYSPAGTEFYTHWMACGFQAAGHAVEVWSFRDSPLNKFQNFGVIRREYEGVPVAELMFNLGVAREKSRREWSGDFQERFFEQHLNKFSPDVVFVTHALKHSTGIFRVCHEKNVPTVAVLTDYWALCPLHTLLRVTGELCDGPQTELCRECVSSRFGAPHGMKELREALEQRPMAMRENFLKAEKIVTLTDFLRQQLISHGYPAERLELLEHGPLTEEWQKPAENTPLNDPPTFLFLGSLVEWKGAHILAEALKHVPEAQLQVRIVGPLHDGDYCQRLRELAADDSRFVLDDSIPHEELWIEMQKAAAVVVPALWFENGSLVAKSALLTGTPLLVSDLGSLAEFKKSPAAAEGHVHFLPPGDSAAWASAMVHMAGTTDPAGRPVRLDTDAAPTFSQNMSRWLAIAHEAASANTPYRK